MSAVTGDVSSVASLVSAAPVFLVEACYSRQSDADAFAAARMREVHLDPALSALASKTSPGDALFLFAELRAGQIPVVFPAEVRLN